MPLGETGGSRTLCQPSAMAMEVSDSRTRRSSQGSGEEEAPLLEKFPASLAPRKPKGFPERGDQTRPDQREDELYRKM